MKTSLIICLLAAASLATAKNYIIDAPNQWTPIHSEHLDMGGTAPDGVPIIGCQIENKHQHSAFQ